MPGLGCIDCPEAAQPAGALTPLCPRADVADMRKMFTSYLESMGSLEGPDVEQLMCSALEAVDQLDNALTLVKVGGGCCWEGMAWLAAMRVRACDRQIIHSMCKRLLALLFHHLQCAHPAMSGCCGASAVVAAWPTAWPAGLTLTRLLTGRGG